MFQPLRPKWLRLRASDRRPLEAVKTCWSACVASPGFATSLITAVILWLVETRFGFAFYSWMFWFIVPVGALLSGFAGASGYLGGSWFFGHRPTRVLLLNVVLASLGTFFTIHYLAYLTLEIEGNAVSDYVSFLQYLDISIRSTSMEFRVRTAEVGATGEVGGLGYGVALVQILGFAVGGFAIYAYLTSMPYCEKCSRYLSVKGRQIRYTSEAEGLQDTAARVLSDFGSGAIASAIEHHGASGSPAYAKNSHLRSTIEVRICRTCEQHWVKFLVEKQSGNDWKEIPELTAAGFTDEVVSV